MAENCSHDCSSCGKDCSSRKPESFIKEPHAQSKIKKVIGIVSGKGGVGKSLTTSLLSVYAHNQGKKVGIIATHGYEGEYATEPFEVGVKRLCIHSNLKYVGMYSVQDNDNLASFQTSEAIEGAKFFARKVIREVM